MIPVSALGFRAFSSIWERLSPPTERSWEELWVPLLYRVSVKLAADGVLLFICR
jgi:hypothetical protein